MLRAVARATLTNLSVQLLAAVSGVLVARALGPEGRGALTAIMLWPTVFGALSLWGADSEISRCAAAQVESRKSLLRLILPTALAFGTVATVAGIAMSSLLLPADKEGLAGLSRIAFLIVPLSVAHVLCFSFAIGVGDSRGYGVARLSYPVCYAALVLGVWLSGLASVESMVAILLGSAVVSVVVSLSYLQRAGTARAAGGVSWLEFLRGSMRFSGTTVGQVLNTNLPQILLVAIVDVRSIGLYATAQVLSMLPSSFGNAMSKTTLAAAAENREDSMTRMAGRVRFAVAVYVLASAVLVLSASYLVPALFGAAFAEAAGILRILSPALAISALANILDHALRGRDIVRPSMSARFLSIATMAIGGIYLTQSAGPVGMAWAVLAGAVFQFAILAAAVCSTFGIRPTSLLIPRPRDIRELAQALLEWRSGRVRA